MRRRYPAGNAGDGVVSFPDQLETKKGRVPRLVAVLQIFSTHIFYGVVVKLEKVHNLQALLTLLQIMANAGNLIII